MKKLNFDTGIQEFDVNGTGVLRFNPSDPNVYNRFFEAKTRIEQLAKEYTDKVPEAAGTQLDEQGWPVEKSFAFMKEIDSKVKAELTAAFGAENDFDAIFNGINLFAGTKSGSMPLTNFLNAVMPIIESGAKTYSETQKNEALHTAKLNREQRRALR